MNRQRYMAILVTWKIRTFTMGFFSRQRQIILRQSADCNSLKKKCVGQGGLCSGNLSKPHKSPEILLGQNINLEPQKHYRFCIVCFKYRRALKSSLGGREDVLTVYVLVTSDAMAEMLLQTKNMYSVPTNYFTIRVMIFTMSNNQKDNFTS